MRRKLVAGNWKMHGTLAENDHLLTAVLAGMADVRAEVAVCVPYPYLSQVQAKLAGSAIAWGAQNMSQHAKGAYTGEVAAAMLNDFGQLGVVLRVEDMAVAECRGAFQQGSLDIHQQVCDRRGQAGLRDEGSTFFPGFVPAGKGNRALFNILWADLDP